MNSVQLIGHLGATPEVNTLPSGDCVAKFPLYVNEFYKDKKTGERKETTTIVTIECWKQTAEFARTYLSAGHRVGIQGSLKLESWKNKATGEARSRLLVRAARIDNLTPKNGVDHSSALEEEPTF